MSNSKCEIVKCILSNDSVYIVLICINEVICFGVFILAELCRFIRRSRKDSGGISFGYIEHLFGDI